MPTLLKIDSSPMGDYSVSRQLTRDFVESWTAANPAGVVIERDLATSNLTPVTGALVQAAYTPEPDVTPQQKQLLAVSNDLLAELFAADELVVGVSMHNFGIPSTLKLWIDLIVRKGKTFEYSETGAEGLVKGKKVTFLIATGGHYGAGTPAAGYNYWEPYLKHIFGFMGMTDVSVITAGGTAALRGGIDRAEFLAPVEAEVRALFA
jgi:FMN-dependent NADH-azoreductase